MSSHTHRSCGGRSGEWKQLRQSSPSLSGESSAMKLVTIWDFEQELSAAVVVFDNSNRTAQISVACTVPSNWANLVSSMQRSWNRLPSYRTCRMGCTCSGQKQFKDGKFSKGKHKSHLSSNHIVSTPQSAKQTNIQCFWLVLNDFPLVLNF